MSAILVIEDDPDILEMLTFTLLRAGHTVGSQIDGRDSATVGEGLVDLIVLGWRIPTRDGFDLCRHLRSQPHYANTPIVLVSDQATFDEVQCGLLAGAAEYITQPFSPRQIITHVNLALTHDPPGAEHAA